MARAQLAKLRFNGSLKGSASELSKQLKQLHEELAAHDQDLIDAPSMDKVAKQCMSPSLLLHKDNGVKAYLAACLADLLRLYAPEAPYTQAELKVSTKPTTIRDLDYDASQLRLSPPAGSSQARS